MTERVCEGCGKTLTNRDDDPYLCQVCFGEYCDYVADPDPPSGVDADFDPIDLDDLKIWEYDDKD